MFKILFNYHWLRLKRYFRSSSTAKFITAAAFALILLGLATGIYFFFRAGFRFIAADPFLTDAMTLYVLELFLLLIFFLVFISSLISGLSALWRRPRDVVLMVSPEFRILPVYVWWRLLAQALWPLLIVALPAVLAMDTVFDLGLGGVLFSLLAVILLIALTVSLAVGLLLALGLLLSLFASALSFGRPTSPVGRPTSPVGRLAFSAGVVAALGLFFAWRQLLPYRDLVKLFQAENLDIARAYLPAIVEHFAIFPSHLSAMTIHQSQASGAVQALNSGLVLLVAAVFGWLLVKVLSRYFLRLWQEIQEGAFEASTTQAGQPIRVSRAWPFFQSLLSSQIGTIFAKEALALLRQPRNLLWLGFLAVIWLMQTELNTVLGENVAKHATGAALADELIQALQFVTVVFFMSAFVLRFAFPAFSAELKTAWLVGASPVEPGKVFRAKLLFYSLIFVALGAGIAWLNVSLLNIPAQTSLGLFGLTLLGVVFVVAFGLSLGAIYPNFESDDPQVLSTTLPGLSFIFGSLAYGAFGAWLIFQTMKLVYFLPLFLFAAGSILIMVGLLKRAVSALKTIEYVKY